MRRRRIATGVVAVAIVAVAGAAIAGSRSSDGSAHAATTATTLARVTAKVARQDLVATTTITGTLSYGAAHAIKVAGSSGGSSSSGSSSAASAQSAAASTTTAATASVITALPALGTVIKQGGQLFEVNGAAGPVLWYGSRPMWRSLYNGVADGLDVVQLEQNLAALGYTHGGQMVVDSHFDLSTGNAIADWQAARGLTKTGIVSTSDVVYGSGPIRVASYGAAVGDNAAGSIYNVTGTTRSIQVALDPANQTYVAQGAKVSVTLPDTKVVQGVVLSIGTVATVATSGGNGGGNASTTTTIPVTIVLTTNPKDALDDSPVTINLVTSRAKNALTVPVNALLALAEGGYALEKVNADGTTTLVAVKPGQFANGFVEVAGNVSEGETVVSA